MSSRRIKIGIDVGGTFTHAVAVDAESLEVIGTSMVPTTHTADEGVARGVVESMHRLLDQTRITPEEVVLIAHSTTQATNALLEGDVAAVGIIGMGKGAEKWRARGQTRIDRLELAPGKFLKTYHRFVDTGEPLDVSRVESVFEELRNEGAEVFVASEAFGVDHPENEKTVVDVLMSKGYLGTSASEISQLYGLRVRTRTAVINVSMMPKMLETANMTERAVRESGIRAPLMIMRSDGGIMDINEMRRRPILTMLSGPAAGVTAALMYVKISDGIFLDVGGTSTDISIIKNGRPVVRTGEVGGHRLHVRTLDIRTVGIGGGSVPRMRGPKVIDVGPRSAHIAGLRYLAFSEVKEDDRWSIQSIQPKPGDPDDYLCITSEHQGNFAFTTAEAANLTGLATTYAKASAQSFEQMARWLGEQLRVEPKNLAEQILEKASSKVISVVRDFIEDYKLVPEHLVLVGGGGGAESVVSHTANKLGVEHRITRHAEVISAIGVALGMIRETVERSIVQPTEADLLEVRRAAMHSVIRMGAAPETVEVRVEVDPKQKRVIATASGWPEMRTRSLTAPKLSQEQLSAVAAKSAGVQDGATCVSHTEFLHVFQVKKTTSKLLGLMKSTSLATRVIDAEGVIRLKLSDAVVRTGVVGTIPSQLHQLVDEFTMYGDAGALQPDVYVLVVGRIVDLSGLINKEQVLSLLQAETESFSRDETAIVLVSKKE